MDDLEKVKERIRKLLALADNNPNVHEAANAAGQAQKLMERYRIEKIAYDIDHDIKDGDGEDDFGHIGRSGSPLDSAGRLSSWRVNLADALASANACRIYISHVRAYGKSKKEIVMVGRESDMAIVRYMYSYLIKEVDRLCKIYCAERDFSKGEGRIAGNNFRLGAIEVIGKRLSEAAKEERAKVKKEMIGEGSDPKALARYENAIKAIDEVEKNVSKWMDENLKLRAGRASSFRGDASAYAAGRAAGRKVDLSKKK